MFFYPTGLLSTNDEAEQGRANIPLDQYRLTGHALRLLSARSCRSGLPTKLLRSGHSRPLVPLQRGDHTGDI